MRKPKLGSLRVIKVDDHWEIQIYELGAWQKVRGQWPTRAKARYAAKLFW